MEDLSSLLSVYQTERSLLGNAADIAICGLFFNLEPIEDSFQFWENLSENLWVALYSVLAPNIPKHSSLIVELNSINIFKNK